MKKHFILLPAFLVFAIGCNSNKTNPDTVINQEQKEETNDVQAPKDDDKYVGDWIDINRDPNDTSELFPISKIHDNEYKIGSLTGKLMVVESNSGNEQAEYLSAWSEGAEIQFIYDNYTQHLMMRTPFFSKELSKAK